MAVDKTLEIIYDLSSLNEQQASQLISANEDVIKSAETQKKKGKRKAKKTDKVEKTKDDKKKKSLEEKEKKKIQQENKKSLDSIKSAAQDPTGTLLSTLKKSIPQLSVILATTGIIISIIKRINELQIKFVENVDKRVNIGISNAEQARVDANLQQVIITNGDGSVNPRNVYNSFNESDANISFTESNYRLDNTSGYE